jgi:hypothetical protein
MQFVQGNGEMAEIGLRCQWDSFTTLRWVLKHDEREIPDLALRLKNHDDEKRKTQLEYIRKQKELHPDMPVYVLLEREVLKEVYQSGTWDPLLTEAAPNWAKVNMREMARAVEDEDSYLTIFARASDIVHGAWRAITRYHIGPMRESSAPGPYDSLHWSPARCWNNAVKRGIPSRSISRFKDL